MKRIYLLTSIIVTMGCILFTGCSKDDDSADSAVEQIWSIAQSHPDGFTVSLKDMSYPKNGIVCAYAETQNSFGKDDLQKVIAHARKHANTVGGWLDSTSKLYYFDSDTIFSEDSLQAAITFARQQKQLAIYIISKDSTVYLK